MDDWYSPRPEHLAKLQEGVAQWNLWRAQERDTVPILRYADLAGVDLAGADLANAELSGAVLSGANLTGALLFQTELYRADLRNSRLVQSDMRGAKLHEADLRGADLRGSNLYRVDFIATQLEATNFANTYCHTTAFSHVDLSATEGLAEVLHMGPSCIDTVTLSRSSGTDLESFFRSSGVPESLLSQVMSLQDKDAPEPFRSCFISYSGEDEDFAKKLYSELRKANLQAWFAPEDLRGGKKIFEQIDHAIHSHDRLLVVLSEHSLASNWVVAEVLRARKRERQEHKQILFPIRLMDYNALENWSYLDPETGTDLGAELREYFILDFSDWQDPRSFEESLRRLLRDLQGE